MSACPTCRKHLLNSWLRSMRGRWQKVWWREAILLLDWFASFLTRIRCSTPAWLLFLFHTRLVLNDLKLFLKKARLTDRESPPWRMLKRNTLRLWPYLTSVSLKFPGKLKGQENHFPMGLNPIFIYLIYLLFLITDGMQYCISFRCTTHIHVTYKVITQ